MQESEASDEDMVYEESDEEDSISGGESSESEYDYEPKKRATGRAVLGREILSEVWSDMQKTTLPTWVTRAPKTAGSSRVGKLSADQWRVFCTVNLVITLVRLWGPEPADSRSRQMLGNFMDLVIATKLATSRTMTTAGIAEIHSRFRAYLSAVLLLFPKASLVSNHHLTLHLPTLFRLFGPTHSWRCFPFERANYILQRIQSNNRFGMWTVLSLLES